MPGMTPLFEAGRDEREHTVGEALKTAYETAVERVARAEAKLAALTEEALAAQTALENFIALVRSPHSAPASGVEPCSVDVDLEPDEIAREARPEDADDDIPFLPYEGEDGDIHSIEDTMFEEASRAKTTYL